MTAPHVARTHATRVLLIADDPLAGKILATQLTVQGHEVHWARDTMEARWLWLPKFYDVVVIDLQKDSASGLGFVRRIKAQFPEQKITFISEVKRENLRENLKEISRNPRPHIPIVKTNSQVIIIERDKR